MIGSLRTTCCLGLSLAMAISVATVSMAGAKPERVQQQTPKGVIIPHLLNIDYSGQETFRYELSWTGGVKLGEIDMKVRPIAGKKDAYELYALVSTKDSIFNTLYPVHDVHVTKVSGERRLPYYYEEWQKEGYSYTAHRVTRYDQENGVIHYQKEGDKPVVYSVNGPTYNEFASFFSSRLMPFEPGSAFLIPTFADDKRVEVKVKVLGRSHFDKTVLGPVDAVKVTPILKFKGLYEKKGKTVVWYTDDECRVPIKITSELMIGSITSTLVSYSNPACRRYTPERLAKAE